MKDSTSSRQQQQQTTIDDSSSSPTSFPSSPCQTPFLRDLNPRAFGSYTPQQERQRWYKEAARIRQNQINEFRSQLFRATRMPHSFHDLVGKQQYQQQQACYNCCFCFCFRCNNNKRTMITTVVALLTLVSGSYLALITKWSVSQIGWIFMAVSTFLMITSKYCMKGGGFGTPQLPLYAADSTN